jgi:quercetin dioxygenase-like cupin family protein
MLRVGTTVEEIRLPGIILRVLIDGPTADASLTMFEMDVLPGGSMPVPHHHLGFDEVLHGLSGKLRMTVQGQVVDVSSGESLLIQGGEVHAFANPFEEKAKVLCVLTPGVFGVQYFREIRELLAPGGPPDPKKAAEVMMRHGLVPAPTLDK